MRPTVLYLPPPSAPPTSVTPLWLELLGERGLSPTTIAHFALAPRGQGWAYPVRPEADERRWKAFDSSATPKYLWLPGKPDDMRFYDVDGALRQRIAAGGGDLWLAGGESDVWALWEGGISNATCLFDGEARAVPDWFVAELRTLGVRTLHLAPDRDRAGVILAGNVCEALWHSKIEPVAHRLPFEMGSKGDIGRLLLEVGPARLRGTLDALPQVALTCEGDDPRLVQRPLPHLLSEDDRQSDAWKLYEQWCVAVVEAAAVQRWEISPPDRKGFSKNFCCPFHPDRHPSAGWNYNTHGIHCFACGSHDAKEVAHVLGVQPWDDYKAQQRAASRGS